MILMHILVMEKMDHKIRNCPMIAKNEGDNHRRAQTYPFFDLSGGLKKYAFYPLQI